jgi:FkbM family methyltransferase
LRGRGRLIAIEPVPQNAALLKRNLALNGYADVPVVEAAVSDVEGERSFFLSEQSNLGTFHPTGTGAVTLTGEKIDVATVTVPMLAERFGKPDLLRMDVEGHEVEVIDGMLDDIRRGAYAPMIIFETHLTRYGEHHDMARTLRALFAEGYGVPLLSSSSDRGTSVLTSMGYEPQEGVATDGVVRRLFENIRHDDAISIICETGGSRTVVLARSHPS